MEQQQILLPVEADFEAHCPGPSPEAWQRFEKLYLRKGCARLELESSIQCQGKVCLRFKGQYAVV
jgi:thioesterase domain-containing protein